MQSSCFLEFHGQSLTLVFLLSVSGKSHLLWTDVILSLIIFGGFVSLVTVGLTNGDSASGSRGTLLDRARSERRLERGSFAVDITDNDSYINIFIGQLIFWTVAYSAFYSLGKYVP